MHVFCASITLVREASGTNQPTDELLDCIKSELNFLDQVQSDYMVVKEGLKIVQRLCSTVSPQAMTALDLILAAECTRCFTSGELSQFQQGFRLFRLLR